MHPTRSHTPPATTSPVLSESQKAALVKLLTDEDLAVYHAVRGKILSVGDEALSWLRPHTLSSDVVLRRRAHEIIQHLTKQRADGEFLKFAETHGDDLDLEGGVWLLAKTQYPEINTAAYGALLDAFASELRDRIGPEHVPLNILAIINDYLFQELGFTGNQESYYDPDNSYFNKVVDRRTGNPISLCTLYWLLAKRLQLPVVGIGMPGHFLCRFQSATEAFYIDAFNRGKVLTKTDCVKYLQQSSHGFHESFLSPLTSGRTLLRMCSNLHQIYTHLELQEDVTRLQRYLVALAK